MSTQTILPIDREAVAALSASSQEPAWVTALRLEALELAGQLELPLLEKTRINRWKLDDYGVNQSETVLNSTETLPAEIKALLPSGDAATASNVIIQRNSGIVFAQLSEELAAKGVIFTSMEDAVRNHSSLVQPYFMKAIEKQENRLAALHAAYWNGGVFLYVPRNVTIELPFQALFYTEKGEASFTPHVLIVAEANSRVTYVDSYVSSEEGHNALVHNGVVEVFVKQGALVQYASVHNMNEQVTDITYRRAIVENDGRIEWIVGEMHNGNAISDTSSVLKGNGSTSDAKILCVGTHEQNLNITTRAVHFGRSTDSQMITRAIMRDEATAIINGITKIEKGATKANGEQTEKVLMLSPKARGDANPILLIDEDDVTAGHAASVGQVNPEQVYYLMSRGISKREAEKLIINGFLAPVIAEISLENIRLQLQSTVERKLGR